MNKQFFAILSIAFSALAATGWAQDIENLPYHTDAGKVIDISKESDQQNQRALSPDGTVWAVLIAESDAKDAEYALWICSKSNHVCRIVLKPADAEAPEHRLAGINSPLFSLKGNFVYVMTDGWAVSGAIHQVNVETGKEKFVADANSMRLILNGEYAGDLLVEQHRYHPAPLYGSYDAINVIDPAGKVLHRIGSDEGDPAVEKWIADNKIELRP